MIDALSVALPMSVNAGINLYLTAFLIGLSKALGFTETLPTGLDPLADPGILFVTGVLTFLDFFADKIPYADMLWNGANTAIEPVGAMAISSSVAADIDPLASMVVMFASGGAAMTSHLTKLGLRVFVNASPDPVGNTAVSATEDAGVAGFTLLLINNPIIALILALIVLTIMAIVLPRLIRWTMFWYRAIRTRFGAQITEQDLLPGNHLRKLPGEPKLTSYCALRTKGKLGRFGYLSLVEGRFIFTYSQRMRGVRTTEVDPAAATRKNFRSGMLMDVLTFMYYDEKRNLVEHNFVFLKNRSTFAAQFREAAGVAEPVPAGKRLGDRVGAITGEAVGRAKKALEPRPAPQPAPQPAPAGGGSALDDEAQAEPQAPAKKSLKDRLNQGRALAGDVLDDARRGAANLAQNVGTGTGSEGDGQGDGQGDGLRAKGQDMAKGVTNRLQGGLRNLTNRLNDADANPDSDADGADSPR